MTKLWNSHVTDSPREKIRKENTTFAIMNGVSWETNIRKHTKFTCTTELGVKWV